MRTKLDLPRDVLYGAGRLRLAATSGMKRLFFFSENFSENGRDLPPAPSTPAQAPETSEHAVFGSLAGGHVVKLRKVGIVHVAHRFPMRGTPHRDPSAYLLSPTQLLTWHIEDVRHLVAHLDRRLATPGMVMMASGRHAEGRSITALNLAVALAQDYARVVCVELDFRRPALHTFFDLPAIKGAADLLLESAPLGDVSECMLATDVAGLYLLPAGAHPAQSGLLASPRLPELFAQLRNVADWAIVDCAPLLTYDDALPLLGLVDGVVVIAREGRTRDEDRVDISTRLAAANATIVDTITVQR